MAEDDYKARAKKREDMFLRRLFGMLGKMAKADRKVDAWEAHAAEAAFGHWPRAAARRKYCARMFNEGKDSRIALYRMAWDFANKLATAEDCLFVYGLLWDIACARGVLHRAHESNLRGICKYLNLPESYFDIYYRKRRGTFRTWTCEDEAREQEEIFRERERARAARYRQEEARRREAEARREAYERTYQQRMHDWFHGQSGGFFGGQSHSPLATEYALLGCACDASDAAVRNAYRVAAKKCHPDMLRAQGASEEQVRQATAKMAQLNAAWEKIRKERNI